MVCLCRKRYGRGFFYVKIGGRCFGDGSCFVRNYARGAIGGMLSGAAHMMASSEATDTMTHSMMPSTRGFMPVFLTTAMLNVLPMRNSVMESRA